MFDYVHYLHTLPRYSSTFTYVEVTAKYVCRAPSVTPGATSIAGDVPNGQSSVSTCPVAEDLTAYSPTVTGQFNSANQVTDPLGNRTTYQFAVCGVYPYQFSCESSRQTYQGTSTLLRTVQTTYSGQYPSSKTTILPNGLQGRVEWDYWARDLVKERRDFAWGQGAYGSLARRTYYGGYCFTKPTSEIVYDGSGNQLASTTYEFDNYTAGISLSGAVQHNSSYNSSFTTGRCNVTAIQRWLNTGGTQPPPTRMQYDDAGNVTSTLDPNGNTTSFSYADNFTDGVNHGSAAFVTQATYPPTNGVAHIEKKQYFYNMGLLAASCGQNYSGACTNTASLPQPDYSSITYDLMGRPVAATSGDTGQTSTCFSEVSGSSCYSSSFPLKVVSTQKITSSLNKVSTAVLDGLARPTQTQLNSDPEGVTYVDTTYDQVERKSTVTNPYRTTSDPTYGITTYNYDALDRITKVIPPDSNGSSNYVSTSYDALPVVGNPVTNCTLVTDQAGKQRRSCSDALGRLVEVDEPGSVAGATPGTGSFTISGSEQSKQYTCGPNNQQCTMYDAGTITVTVNGVGYQQSYGQNDTASTIASALAVKLNGGGLVTASASGAVISITANTSGSSTNYPLTTSVAWNQTNFTNPSFTASRSGSNMTGGTDGGPGGGQPSMGTPLVTLYQYDLLNNLLRVDQKGDQPSDSTKWRTRTFTYNSLSQLLCAANPETTPVGSNCPTSATGTFPAGATTYAYDNDGNLLTKTSPKPNQTTSSVTVQTTYAYDVDNRLTQKSYNDSFTPTVKFAYDGTTPSGCTTTPPAQTDLYPKGRRTAMCDVSGATSWTHDLMGRTLTDKRTIAGSTNFTKTTTYQYNLDSSLWKLTYPGTGDTVTYTVGTAGRTTAAQDTANGFNYVTNAHYAAFGGLTSLTHGASISVQDSYTNRLQPLLISAAAGASNIISLCYDFHSGQAWTSGPCSFPAYTSGDNGNVVQIVNNRTSARSQNFTYDALNRIATAYSTGANWGEDFTIDAWGNLTNRTQHTGKTSYEPLAAPALSNNRLTGFGYDAAGNMTSNGSASYTYDAESHLVFTNGYAYFYDADGNRVKKCTSTAAFTCSTGATGTEYWSGIGSDSLSESDLAGTTNREYIFFNGKRVARLSPPSTVRYIFSDHLGSHDLITDAAGTIQKESDYYPYGGEIPISGTMSEAHKFTGKERDAESGLDNFGARFDASNLGRFMSPDMILGHLGDPQTLNRYAYVRNSPTLLIDPTGLDGEWCQGVRAQNDELDRALHGWQNDELDRAANLWASNMHQLFVAGYWAAQDASSAQNTSQPELMVTPNKETDIKYGSTAREQIVDYTVVSQDSNGKITPVADPHKLELNETLDKGNAKKVGYCDSPGKCAQTDVTPDNPMKDKMAVTSDVGPHTVTKRFQIDGQPARIYDPGSGKAYAFVKVDASVKKGFIFDYGN